MRWKSRTGNIADLISLSVRIRPCSNRIIKSFCVWSIQASIFWPWKLWKRFILARFILLILFILSTVRKLIQFPVLVYVIRPLYIDKWITQTRAIFSLLFFSVDEKFESVKPVEATLTSDGTITWYAPMILQVSCKVKVRFFPFDQQQCNISISSWRYDKSGLNLIPIDDADANQNVFDENGVWNLKGISRLSDEKKYNCCEHGYAMVVINLTLKRKPAYYLYNVIAPCMMLSPMTVFVFRLPPESGEKISLGMTNVLALILFQQLIAENMPPLGDEIPVIGKTESHQMYRVSQKYVLAANCSEANA